MKHKLPILSEWRQLDPPAQRFLMYVAINVVSWQNIIGPVMVLFARKLGMPESYVGMLLACMPFSTLLVLFTLPMIIRFGPKKVLFQAWLWRNVVVSLVFLMPFALNAGYERLAWIILLTSIILFSIMRALGSGGWLPWLHELIPENKRGLYFSTEAAITQMINVLVLLAQAWFLMGNPGIGRFLGIYALGVGMGFWSLLWMRRIPGGRASAKNVSFKEGFFAYGPAFRDHSFLWFLVAIAYGSMATLWFNAASIMYLHDILQIPDSMTMVISALGSIAIMFTIKFWGRFAEARGSARALAKTLLGFTPATLIFMFMPSKGPWMVLGAACGMILALLFYAAYFVIANRAMLNHAPEEHRIAYTALWTVMTAISQSITPILAGCTIQYFELTGYKLCFGISLGMCLTGAILSLILVKEGSHPITSLAQKMLNPALPLRTMVRIIWITAGLHESSRLSHKKPSSQPNETSST